MKSFKNYVTIIFLISLIGVIVFFTGCKKEEEPGNQQKELLTQNLNSQISADTLESFVIWLQNMGTRFALAPDHRDVAMNIRNRFINMGYANARLDSFLIDKAYLNTVYHQWQYNVVATLEGKSSPDSVCILGGHYDDNLKSGDPFSVVPGANDNASGTASVLEIARIMIKNNYSPANTIEFIAFGSEELGLYGSTYYASNAGQTSKKIKMVLNNDMVAYQPGMIKSDWIVNIMDYNNSYKLRLAAEQMCTRFTALKFTNDNTYNKQSDSYPFSVNGFEALFFFSNIVDPNYHTLSDLPSSCNFEYCKEIAKICCALLVDKN